MTPFDPERLLKALAHRGVSYILVGAVAARLQGFPRMTADADITPATDAENLGRLAAALRDLEARIYTESVPDGLPFDFSAESLSGALFWNLTTKAGRLDVIFEPAGTKGYEDLTTSALSLQVFGVEVRAASLQDIVRSKQASDRPQDRQDAIVLRQMLRERK